MKNKLPQNNIINFGLIQISLFVVTTVFSIIFFYGVVLAQADVSNESTTDKSTPNTSPAQSIDSYEVLHAGAYRPYLVDIVDGDSVITTPVMHTNPESILKEEGIIVYPEDTYALVKNENYQSRPLVGFTLRIERAAPIEINLHGSTSSARTQSDTVGQLLKEKNIILDEVDLVNPSSETKITPGMKISIVRVGTEIITIDEDVDFQREFIDDTKMAYGTTVMKTPGIRGKAKVTYKITYYDNIETSRTKISSITLKQPSAEIVIRGTKGAPTSNGPLSAAQIQFLGNCESGMTATRNSGNGYYGAFQFSAGTWTAMGTGYARADLAPLDVQIQAVQQLLSRSSIFSQFPGCANSMVAAGLL